VLSFTVITIGSGLSNPKTLAPIVAVPAAFATKLPVSGLMLTTLLLSEENSAQSSFIFSSPFTNAQISIFPDVPFV
jgi:hypothetical protein